MRLYPYQRDALNRLRPGAILNGGVGSGKSITALAYYVKMNGGDAENLDSCKNKIFTKLYIITTARKRDTKEWELELSKIGIDMLNPKKSTGKASVVIDSWNNIKKYAGVKNAFFIFDEQRVVGSGAWVKAFYKIAKKPTTNTWVLLSATPGDTWMDYIPVFVANGFYKNRTAFIREHVIYDNYSKFPKIRGYLNEEKLFAHRNKILVKMNYKREITRKYIKVGVEYNKNEYSMITKLRQNPYDDNRPIKNISQYCALQRYCVNKDSSRLKAVKQLMKQHDKLIVFYNFDYELAELRKLKREPGICYAEWTGHQHDKIPNKKKWVYAVQYLAGCEGWNCTETDSMIFYSLPYSYRQYEQACGRIDRVNTPYSTLYFYTLESSSRIDYRIKACLKEKRNFNVIDEYESFKR